MAKSVTSGVAYPRDLNALSADLAALGGAHAQYVGISPTAWDSSVGATLSAGTGGPNGSYYYFITATTATGESACWTGQPTAIVTSGEKYINLTGIPTFADPAVTGRNLYRTKNIASDTTDSLARAPQLVHSFADNTTTTWQDTVADASLGVFAPFVSTLEPHFTYNSSYAGSFLSSSLFLGVDGPSARNLGYANVGVGRYALAANAGGVRNVAFGVYALAANLTGVENTALGTHALAANTDGDDNIGIGFGALSKSTTANNCVAVGSYAGYSSLTASQQTLIGAMSGFNLTGNQTVGVGYAAGKNATSGSGNIFIGYVAGGNAGTANLTGSFNTITGYQAGAVIASGAATNTLYGFQSGYTLTSGSRNIGVGPYTCAAVTTGNGSVHLGASAGRYETSGDTFYVNNQDRTNTSGDKTLSLMYGTFAATAAGQKLTINAPTKTLTTTVAGLPAASIGAGFRAFVTDATATTFASTVAGGGSNNVPVYSDGTNWKIG